MISRNPAYFKAELHCHLDGVIDENMLRTLAVSNPSIVEDLSNLQHSYPVTSYRDFRAWFDYTRSFRQQGNLVFQPIIDIHIQRLKKQQVKYTELIIQPFRFAFDLNQILDEIHALRHFVDRCEDQRIQVEFLMSIARNRPRNEIEKQVEIALILFREKLICGVSFAGEERNFPVKPVSDLFRDMHRSGLKIEIHTGEWCGPESIWDAIEYGYPDRIGHGISIFQDVALTEYFQKTQLHIEMCPTSNLRTGSIDAIEYHPIQQARELDMNYSINTDDPGCFQCSISSEFDMVATLFYFTTQDFIKIWENSICSRFQPQLRYINDLG